MRTGKSKQVLLSELKTIQENGIQADRQHLKQNMHTQFADPFEFSREYAVNSYDAMATACYFSGRETDDTVTITIRDNGKGMNQERIQDYFKIFRSRKDCTDIKPIGRFGVGKMSVAAVPGLIRFAGTTSTGDECWRFETDSLIEDRPVTLERIEPVPASGTRFEITFKKTATLAELLTRIYDILYKYVRHLNIDIYFDMPEVDKHFNPVRKKLISGNWLFDPDNLGKAYNIIINGVPTEIIMGLGSKEHEIYQNHVYVTSKYNLISFGLKETIDIPNLKIRVNSEAFELTFGRHCLSNESILTEISAEIREKILPRYFDFLLDSFSEDLLIGSPELASGIEEMACGLIVFKPGIHAWSDFQLFKVHNQTRLSFNELSRQVEKSGIVYLEATGCEGTDYSVFDAPVLKLDQPRGGLELIEKIFGPKIINLNLQDVIIENPSRSELLLTPEEKNFERSLVLKPKKDVLEQMVAPGESHDTKYSGSREKQVAELENAVGICEEAKVAELDLYALSWKVNYLVERDGKTPCNSRKFLFKAGTVVLNLNHPEIREYVELSRIDVNLAAHWAIAMCLSDPKLMSHVTYEAREDLLLIDAIGRMGEGHKYTGTVNKADNKSFLDFLRNCSQPPYWNLNKRS